MTLCILFDHADARMMSTQSPEEHAADWNETCYRAHQTFLGSYATMFDQYKIEDGKGTSDTSPSGPNEITPETIMYAWHLLALLSTRISSDQCHQMVAELRDPIIKSANSSNPLDIRNANLLLNVVGLDASQLKNK